MREPGGRSPACGGRGSVSTAAGGGRGDGATHHAGLRSPTRTSLRQAYEGLRRPTRRALRRPTSGHSGDHVVRGLRRPIWRGAHRKRETCPRHRAPPSPTAAAQEEELSRASGYRPPPRFPTADAPVGNTVENRKGPAVAALDGGPSDTAAFDQREPAPRRPSSKRQHGATLPGAPPPVRSVVLATTPLARRARPGRPHYTTSEDGLSTVIRLCAPRRSMKHR